MNTLISISFLIFKIKKGKFSFMNNFKLKHISYVIFTLIFIGILFISVFSVSNNEIKTVISIGVPNINDAQHNYFQFKEDLENKFDILVDLVELYPENSYTAITEKDVIENIEQIVKNNKLDMIIGLTPNKLKSLIDNDMLLDITTSIDNINNIHKGLLNDAYKGGSGKLYYISPIINNIYFILQNKKIFDELNIDLLAIYPSYDEVLNTLSLLETSIEKQNSQYSPIAFAVKNFDEYELFIGPQFRMLGYNLKTPFYKDGQVMNNEWKSFYNFFATLTKAYGKGYEDYENGIYPGDNIFSNGNYAIMFADLLDIEIYFNNTFNKEYNKQAPTKLNNDFPIQASFYPNKNGEKIQNTRQSVLAIIKKSDNINTVLKIINYIFSEEYALKMIETRGKYNYFSSYTFTYPAYYNEKTISVLNQLYNENFDTSIIYDVNEGSGIETYPVPDNYLDFDIAVNKALTSFYYNNKTLDESYKYILELFK